MPIVDISPAATPESIPRCKSTSTPTPAAESSAISRAAMTNIRLLASAAMRLDARGLPAPSVRRVPERVIRSTKPFPAGVWRSCASSDLPPALLAIAYVVLPGQGRENPSPLISERNVGHLASSSARYRYPRRGLYPARRSDRLTAVLNGGVQSPAAYAHYRHNDQEPC